MILKKIYISAICFLALLFIQNATAATIDGRVTAGEYTDGITYDVDLGYMSGGSWMDVGADGKIALTWQSENLLAVAYTVPFAINDNFFGTASFDTGWNKNVGRSYSKLETSDMAQFLFVDESGNELLTFQMDYFRDTDLADINGSGGIDTTKNSFITNQTGSYQPGSTEFDGVIVDWGTSLMWNFGDGGFFFNDASSPVLGTQGYIGEMVYEFLIDTSSFGSNLGMLLAESHHSPSKLGQESFSPPPGDDFTPPNPVPEPAALLIFGAGIVGISSLRRRK